MTLVAESIQLSVRGWLVTRSTCASVLSTMVLKSKALSSLQAGWLRGGYS